MILVRAVGKGPLTSPGCDHGAFVKTNPALAEADLQVTHSHPITYHSLWAGREGRRASATGRLRRTEACVEGQEVSTSASPVLSFRADLMRPLLCGVWQLRFVAGRGHMADGVRSYIEIGKKGQVRQPRPMHPML